VNEREGGRKGEINDGRWGNSEEEKTEGNKDMDAIKESKKEINFPAIIEG
jgi:hypothetical protein